jgi:hypothetical protein
LYSTALFVDTRQQITETDRTVSVQETKRPVIHCNNVRPVASRAGEGKREIQG